MNRHALPSLRLGDELSVRRLAEVDYRRDEHAQPHDAPHRSGSEGGAVEGGEDREQKGAEGGEDDRAEKLRRLRRHELQEQSQGRTDEEGADEVEVVDRDLDVR